MAKKRRKPKKKPITSKFTPIRYLMTKARDLPIAKVYIKDIWDSDGITIALVIRQQGNGKYIIGCYILDTYCLGLRESFFKFNMTWEEIEFWYLDINNKVEGGVYVESTPKYVQGFIKACIQYAETLGLEPHLSFQATKFLLDPMEDIKAIDMMFGYKGRPTYITTPQEINYKLIHTLNKSLGEENYDLVMRKEVNYLLDKAPTA